MHGICLYSKQTPRWVFNPIAGTGAASASTWSLASLPGIASVTIPTIKGAVQSKKKNEKVFGQKNCFIMWNSRVIWKTLGDKKNLFERVKKELRQMMKRQSRI